MTVVSGCADVRHVFDRTLNAFGSMDVLVNCGGACAVEDITQTSEVEWNRFYGTNVKGVFFMYPPPLYHSCAHVAESSSSMSRPARNVIVADAALPLLSQRKTPMPKGNGMPDATIDEITGDRSAHYEPFGWHHWPEHPWLSYQFRRMLGESQEGGGAVSECFLAASRMTPGDKESWHVEWLRVAEQNRLRGYEAESAGHVETAKNCWLRAANYYRAAEFWLSADDPRRLKTFARCEESSQKAGEYFRPPIEVVKIPYEKGAHLSGYFIQSPVGRTRQPVLISFGGLDSFKDELLFMTGFGALRRGIAALLVDGPGQGATLRRFGIPNRYDYEVPVGRCIDYLETRDEVDPTRIAVCGSSLGGYYAARAGCFEHRLAGVVSHGAIWSIDALWGGADERHGLAEHIKWVFGKPTMAEALAKGEQFTLEGILGGMQCPYFILHGKHDVLGVSQAQRVHDEAHAHGVDVTLRFITPDETGAEHCQHDNPTIGEELIGDWLADRFAIDQRRLSHSGSPAR